MSGGMIIIAHRIMCLSFSPCVGLGSVATMEIIIGLVARRRELVFSGCSVVCM